MVTAILNLVLAEAINSGSPGRYRFLYRTIPIHQNWATGKEIYFETPIIKQRSERCELLRAEFGNER
jgi:hypothetical protein